MKYYDGLAAGYDELHGEEQRRKLSIIREHLCARRDELLLDVGCGTGLSSEFFDCRIIGIDSSREMLLEAKRKRAEKTEYILATGEHLPFKSNVFDRVICVTALHNFTSPEGAILEIKRACTRAGAVTLLKKADKTWELEKVVNDFMEVTRVIDEEKDRIFFFDVPGSA